MKKFLVYFCIISLILACYLFFIFKYPRIEKIENNYPIISGINRSFRSVVSGAIDIITPEIQTTQKEIEDSIKNANEFYEDLKETLSGAQEKINKASEYIDKGKEIFE